MTTETKNTLQQLIGLQFTQTSRNANMECLKFGVKTNNNNQNIGEFALHIQTTWRIINKEKIIIGSTDIYEPISENQSETDFNYEDDNLRDEKLKNILDSNDLIVSKVIEGSFNGLNIQFSNNTTLQIIPTNSSDSEYHEYWRLIDNRELKPKHFVARINGIKNE